MSMTVTQARRLGRFIASSRTRKKIGVRELAGAVGVSPTWVAQLEAGDYLDPAQDRLARVADALDIPPARIDAITKKDIAASLPALRTYFRTKYDMTPEEIDKVARYVERLRRAA